MTAGTAEDSGHIKVTWGNAISRDRVTCCYDDPATALRDAWDRELELWNNTYVEVSWHASHEGGRQREAESAGHRPASLWQWCACGPGRCTLPERHWAAEHAEIAEAAAAAGITPVPRPGYEGHLIARVPERPGRAPGWRPGPGVLAAARRGGILVAGHARAGHVSRLAGLLGRDLDGTLTVRGGPGATAPGQTGPLARRGHEGLRPGPGGRTPGVA